MKSLINPFRGRGLDHPVLAEVPFPSIEATAPARLLSRCPVAAETPLIDGAELGLGTLHVKDERGRMGLGSFKALGAAYVIARDADAGDAAGHTYVTASAGNHGLSVAAGAAAFGARAVIYLSETVPEGFAERLRAMGAEVMRHGAIYEDSMAGALEASETKGWRLLSDSSWPGYHARPHVLMEGYCVLMAEAIAQIPAPPSHVFLQAGVGGLAGACAAMARAAWGEAPQIVVVEPEAAPALMGSIEAGAPVACTGQVSAMGRLDCKEPSLIALKGLTRDADLFVTLSEAEGAAGAELCAAHGLDSTASGAAGISALIEMGLPPEARALVILSEGP